MEYYYEEKEFYCRNRDTTIWNKQDVQSGTSPARNNQEKQITDNKNKSINSWRRACRYWCGYWGTYTYRDRKPFTSDLTVEYRKNG